MELQFNPFSDNGITSFEQYQQYPFLILGTLKMIQNRIQQQINQIQNGYFFGERLLILGERGIGKTSALCFIKGMLSAADINVVLFSRLMEDAEYFKSIVGEELSIMSEKPTYILIDFPDTIESKAYKVFLDFLWSLITHKNYNKINLIFSLNRSHYDRSFAYSEILGKFTTFRLERLSSEETNSLISSRMTLVNETPSNLFGDGVLNLIQSYSKGIPRNIVSACSILLENSNGEKVNIELAERILKEKYAEQVINDRITDKEKKGVSKVIVDILKNEFNGVSPQQEELVVRVRERLPMGRNTVLAIIKDLEKIGVISQMRGGYNRLNKITSIS